jgi:hypothetical protein
MNDIIITENMIFRPADIFLCKTCTDNGKFPAGKPFFPATDLDAVGHGLQWTCGECISTERKRKDIELLYRMNERRSQAIEGKYEKLIISLRTAQAKEYPLDKEQTSYDDL